MADPKDKANAPTSTTPAGKSGAVKPPVLEGTARPAESVKPSPTIKPEAPKTEPLKGETPSAAAAKKAESRPLAPPPVSSAESGAGTAWLAGLVGGVVGLGAAYGLALLGYWPAMAPAPQPADPRIAAISTTVPELEAVTSTLQGELARLTARVAGLETSPGTVAAPSDDTASSSQIAGDLAALSARLDELAAAPQAASDTSAKNAAAIAALEADLAALRQASAQTQANLDGVAAKIATLETDLSKGSALEAGQVRLPLIVSGFETAFATGRPFDGEVAALRQALPDLALPDAVLSQAMTGLKRPDLIARDFNAVLPEILAGRPVGENASWQDATSNWFRGIIALRPTEAVEGEGPEAMVARLEGAVGRGDFIAAKAELDALPPTMKAATGAVADDIGTQAAAQTFLAALRQAALAGGNGA